MTNKVRYILNGCFKPTDPISNYRLIGRNISGSSTAIRVNIPDDLLLEKWSCDPYSTTSDTRTANELGYDVLVRINKKWIVMNEFKDIEPHNIHKIMNKRGYQVLQYYGYVTHDTYAKWMNNEILHYSANGNPIPNYDTLRKIIHNLDCNDRLMDEVNLLTDNPETIYIIDSVDNTTYEIIMSGWETNIRKTKQLCDRNLIKIDELLSEIKDRPAMINPITHSIILK